MAKETNIDSMKYRKSTHLAAVDVETLIAEKGKCVVTIKEAYYNTKVDVSGNKTDGYFIEFVDEIKPMVVNSGNRKVIGNIVKSLKNCTPTESRNIGNWSGVQIELTFDPTVKMMGQIVGGIRIVPPVIKIVSDVTALETINKSTTLDELKANWELLSGEEKKLPTVMSRKETLKNELK